MTTCIVGGPIGSVPDTWRVAWSCAGRMSFAAQRFAAHAANLASSQQRPMAAAVHLSASSYFSSLSRTRQSFTAFLARLARLKLARQGWSWVRE